MVFEQVAQRKDKIAELQLSADFSGDPVIAGQDL